MADGIRANNGNGADKSAEHPNNHSNNSSAGALRDEYVKHGAATMAVRRRPDPIEKKSTFDDGNKAKGNEGINGVKAVSAAGHDSKDKTVPNEKSSKGVKSERPSGAFDLNILPSAKPVDVNGRIPVDKFDQIPAKRFAVDKEGKISLDLHQETTVNQPNDPKNPDLRNRQLRFGKRQADGSIPCSAYVSTRSAADGTVNHITLDQPHNLQVAGEQFVGKRILGREVGIWKSGESPVKKVVFDGTSTNPEVKVTFDHPLSGETISREPLSKEDFAQMVAWVEGARKRASTSKK
jgi:hypothetical protein